MNDTAKTYIVRTMDESTTASKIDKDDDAADKSTAPGLVSKKKVRKGKNKRRKTKRNQTEEQQNVAVAIASDSATDNKTSFRQEGSPYFVINLSNGRKLKFFRADPNLNTYQESIASLNNRKAAIQQLCTGDAEELISQQKNCRNMIANLKEDIKLQLVPSSNIDEHIIPHFSGRHNQTRASTNISSSMSVAFSDLAIDDVKSEDLVSFAGYDMNDLHVEFESFNRMIPSVENRKTYRHFLTRFRDEICSIEEVYNQAIVKARNELKKKEIKANFLELRSKLGFKETDITNVVSVQQFLPIDVSHALFHPLNISRKLSRFFAVILSPVPVSDRIVTKQLQFTVVGLNEDVKKCIDYLKIIDFSGKTKLSLCSNKIAALIGPGGSVIRKVEDNFLTSIVVGSDEIALYGSAENMEKLKTHLETVIFKQIRERFIYEGIDIPTLIYQALSRLRYAEIQNIGEETGTIVQLLEKEDTGRITIRGKKPEEVLNAKKQIQILIGTLTFFPLPALLCATKLFLNCSEMSSLRSGKDFAVIEQVPNGLFLIGSKACASSVLPAIEKTLKKLSCEPVRFRLHQIQTNRIKANKFDEFDKLDVLGLISQADEDHCFIDLYGEKSTVEQVQRIVNDFVAMHATMEKISLSSESWIIVRKDRSMLRQIETLTGVQLSTTRKEIVIIGGSEAVATAKISIEKWLSDQASITESLAIEKFQIPILIGREGMSIRTIKAESMVQNITIDDTNLVVKLTGNKEAVEHAKQLVKSSLSRENANFFTNPVKTKSIQSREITPAIQKLSPPTKIDISNEKIFPSLIESLSK